MKANLMLAEAATVHPDGTISLLRAWINNMTGPTAPYEFRGAFAVRILAESGDIGPHTFDLRGIDQDGTEIMPTLQGDFEVAKGGGATMFVLGMHFGFKTVGNYEFILRVDRVQLALWPLKVEQVQS
ncbi:MAG: hypothetical protein ABI054_06500 [Planctomycetota bacterium]